MRRLPLVTALALGSSVAQGNNGLFYLGAGITDNSAKSVGVQGFDNLFPNTNGASWQVFAGIRPISLFAVEADYLDLGSNANTFQTPLSCVSVGSCAVTWKSEAKALAGYAVGFLPISVQYLDVYGKAGIASYKLGRTVTSYNSGGVSIGSSAYPDNSTAVTWGAGVQARFGVIGGRLEYAGFNRASTSVFSLSVFMSLK